MAFGAPFPGSSAVIVSKVDSAGPGPNTVGNTFNGVNFGTAFATRYLVAAIGGDAALGASAGITVTIGGVAATRIAHVSTNAVTVETFADIWIALVPTGASGTIAIGTASNCGLTLYSLNGLSSPTADATATQSSGSDNLAQNIAVNSNGAVFGIATVNGTNPTAAWTGLTLDTNPGVSSNMATSQASASLLAAQTLAVSVSFPGTRGWALALASFH